MADEKITKMTPEQEALIPQYVSKWIEVGKDTARLDPVKTKEAIGNDVSGYFNSRAGKQEKILQPHKAI